MFKTTLLAGLAASAFALPAFADINIVDPFARSSGMMARAGAAFFIIENTGDEADRLIDAKSDISKITELHTHKDMGDGIMKMVHVPEGFEIPAHGTHALARGGDHVMFMGLLQPMNQGDTVTVTLTFEKAGDITVEIPVDLERGEAAMPMDHSKMGN
ncbi:copper-binding protein [Celeribacter ethanolicus]|uniref:Copper-binding protein n=1 Tax=Celeribacter ethanolicus TaxID=1758178 RepID=A0A291GH26_9RHOB|nr:copper chaperone PCu(A)C [Celeribacter ethanolicus]ATG49362.1 copper-binding protein [Celeribacter ethanolicus]